MATILCVQRTIWHCVQHMQVLTKAWIYTARPGMGVSVHPWSRQSATGRPRRTVLYTVPKGCCACRLGLGRQSSPQQAGNAGWRHATQRQMRPVALVLALLSNALVEPHAGALVPTPGTASAGPAAVALHTSDASARTMTYWATATNVCGDPRSDKHGRPDTTCVACCAKNRTEPARAYCCQARNNTPGSRDWEARLALLEAHKQNLTGLIPGAHAIGPGGKIISSYSDTYANFAPYYPRLKAMGLKLYAFLGNVGGQVRFCIENDELCIKNDVFCINNDEFRIPTDEFCIRARFPRQ